MRLKAEAGWIKQTIQLTVVAGLFLAAGSIWVGRQSIVDYISAWNYEPSASMTAIKQDLRLTSKGSLYFDASQPRIESASSFNNSCDQKKETNNPIVGCYVNYRIYIYNVTNQKLDGIEQTTAAHELLHAAYARLTTQKKQELKPILEAAYNSVKTPELEKRIQYYRANEPGEELNELHSILGTEYSNLGKKLNDYYRQYFENRQAIVVYHDSYETVFNQLTEKAGSLLARVKQMAADINAEIKSYNSDTKQLNTDISDFKRRNDDGEFHSSSQFYIERNSLNARSATLQSKQKTINNEIGLYNDLRKQYNSIATETNELNKSINSTLVPTESL